MCNNTDNADSLGNRCHSKRGCLFWSPLGFCLGTVGKAFSLPWVGPALNSFSSMHGQSPKQALRPVQGLICISTNVDRVYKKPSLPRTGFSSTSPCIHDQKKPSPQRTGLSVAPLQPGSRFLGPRCEIKALLTQRRVLKESPRVPLPPRGLN